MAYTVQTPLMNPSQITAANNPYGISPGSDHFAQDMQAAMSRDQWQQYLSTYVPIENQLIQYAMDPETVTKAVAQNRADVATQFAAQPGMQQRRLRGYGIQLDPDQKAAADREFGLQKSLADVSVANTTRDTVLNRQMSIMGGPAPQAQ